MPLRSTSLRKRRTASWILSLSRTINLTIGPPRVTKTAFATPGFRVTIESPKVYPDFAEAVQRHSRAWMAHDLKDNVKFRPLKRLESWFSIEFAATQQRVCQSTHRQRPAKTFWRTAFDDQVSL